jgi:uncharacterized protein
MTYVKYKDTQLKWRWRLLATNHQIIAESGEGYNSEADCDHGISLVKSSYSAPVVKK